MLEEQALLLRPWASATDRHRTRAILDAATGTPLGLARWRHPGGPAWWRWLRGATLAVYETEDESLLFWVQWSWWPIWRWQVRAADAHLVGTLGHFGRWAQDRWGRVLGLIELRTPPSCGRFLTADGWELGTLQRRDEDLLITFTAELQGDPFAKMLLLALVLMSGEW